MFSGLVFRHASSAFTATRHSGERLSTILLPCLLFFCQKNPHAIVKHREAPCDPAYPRSFLLWPPHSCSRLRPSPLRPNQQKKRLSPSKPPPRLPTAATPRRGSFTYPAAVTSTARPARCVSNPRKRPAATDTNPANAVWPARADRLWKFAGVLGRSPDKGRPRFSSSPNLPARALPAKPFMRIALFAAFSGATCLWIRHFKAAPLGRSSLRIGEIPALTARGSLLSGLFL